MELLNCISCHQDKPISEFTYTQKHSDTGKFYTFKRKKCKSCKSTHEAHRLVARLGEEGAIRYKRMEKFRRRCRDTYKIHFQVPLQMLKEQNNKCLVCEKPIDFFRPQWQDGACIDHDHKTNKVRGILCNNCNSGLGYFQDSVKVLQGAIEYLTKQPN